MKLRFQEKMVFQEREKKMLRTETFVRDKSNVRN